MSGRDTSDPQTAYRTSAAPAPPCPHCSHPMAHFQGAQWQCAMSTCPTFGIVVTSPALVSPDAQAWKCEDCPAVHVDGDVPRAHAGCPGRGSGMGHSWQRTAENQIVACTCADPPIKSRVIGDHSYACAWTKSVLPPRPASASPGAEIVAWLEGLERARESVAVGSHDAREAATMAARRGVYEGIAEDIKRKWPALFTAPCSASASPPVDRKGWDRKYDVTKVRDPEGKHTDCEFFVFDLDHDDLAPAALRAYAAACEKTRPRLAEQLFKRFGRETGSAQPRRALEKILVALGETYFSHGLMVDDIRATAEWGLRATPCARNEQEKSDERDEVRAGTRAVDSDAGPVVPDSGGSARGVDVHGVAASVAAADSSSPASDEERARTWTRGIWEDPDDEYSNVLQLIRDVRLETIEACARICNQLEAVSAARVLREIASDTKGKSDV